MSREVQGIRIKFAVLEVKANRWSWHGVSSESLGIFLPVAFRGSVYSHEHRMGHDSYLFTRIGLVILLYLLPGL